MRLAACVRHRTDGTDTAVCRRRTLRMLNFMLLITVVANGHNYVATATAGNAQGRSHDFTLVTTEAERRNI